LAVTAGTDAQNAATRISQSQLARRNRSWCFKIISADKKSGNRRRAANTLAPIWGKNASAARTTSLYATNAGTAAKSN
jgi:hypothetical protein